MLAPAPPVRVNGFQHNKRPSVSEAHHGSMTEILALNVHACLKSRDLQEETSTRAHLLTAVFMSFLPSNR